MEATQLSQNEHTHIQRMAEAAGATQTDVARQFGCNFIEWTTQIRWPYISNLSICEAQLSSLTAKDIWRLIDQEELKIVKTRL